MNAQKEDGLKEKELERINKREYEDDHLSTEERKSVLDRMGVPYTEETLDQVFVEEVLECFTEATRLANNAQGENKNTTITIKTGTWKKLMQLKSYPSETFDEIIGYLVDKEVNCLK